MSHTFFQIRDICQQANCTPETIRYYEKIGLLPKPQRADNGYRLYTEETLLLLRFIQACRSIGFSVDETFQLVQLRNNPNADCKNADQLVQHHLQQVEHKIAQLLDVKAFLDRLNACNAHQAQHCKVLNALNGQG